MDAPVAFVTGASSGIGRGLAVRLAQEGYAVGLAARRLDRLQEVAGDIRDYGGQAVAYQCDVSRESEVRGAVVRCRSDMGPIELLVANAGIGMRTDAGDLDSAEVDHLMSVNFMGAVYAVEAVLPDMLARKSGQLVTVASIAGFGGLPKTAAYSASKAAMINFFESLRLDLEGEGIAVTVVNPGYVQTEMTVADGRTRPFIMEVDEAVDRMIRAIVQRRRSLTFPWPLAAAAWWGRILPRGVYDGIARRVGRD
ncbi:MAG: SDR family NAD(P)-dependent oxidoreductase [Longimicrobiales bacterium]